MKPIIKIILITIITITFSCQRQLPEPELSIPEFEIEVLNDGSSYSFELTSEVAWKATYNVDWLTISPSKGIGSTTVSVKATTNFTGKERTADIIFKQDTDSGKELNLTVKQSVEHFIFSEYPLQFSGEGGSRSITIQTNTSSWMVNSAYPWISISPKSGSGHEGNNTITITVNGNDSRKSRTGAIGFLYSSHGAKELEINQAGGTNTAPNKPQLLEPADNAVGVGISPKLKWAETTDPDGDDVQYIISYSLDNDKWTDMPAISKPEGGLGATLLDIGQICYWKVKVDDMNGQSNSITESDVYSFTAGLKNIYADGEWASYQVSTKDNAPILVFTGDGFVAEDMIYGTGDFDKYTEQAIEAFFSIEPYKTYKEYFTVYKIAAHSPSRNEGNSVFEWKYGDGTLIYTNDSKVFTYGLMIPEVTDNKLKETSMIVVINDKKYAGTCSIYSDGKSVARCPIAPGLSEYTSFANVIMHEAGGHGFGRLADEYISFHNQTIPQTGSRNSTTLRDMWRYNMYQNVSLSSNPTAVYWKDFIGRDGYERVGVYEGAYYYSFGVWRSESTNCMINNIAYFNAISRYLIVKRIKEITGEDFTLTDFLAKDVQELPSEPAYSKSNIIPFLPLAPPIIVKSD